MNECVWCGHTDDLRIAKVYPKDKKAPVYYVCRDRDACNGRIEARPRVDANEPILTTAASRREKDVVWSTDQRA